MHESEIKTSFKNHSKSFFKKRLHLAHIRICQRSICILHWCMSGLSSTFECRLFCDSLIEQRHRCASLALLHHVGLVPQWYVQGGGREATRFAVHLHGQRLEGGEDDLSALMQPFAVAAHLQRRLVWRQGNALSLKTATKTIHITMGKWKSATCNKSRSK